MAKLHNYYVLCPLIDQKSFLGVSQDNEDTTVIVSLGRNVVNKYRFSDQKQVGGWTSKDHITSAVVYDKENDEYVGVFNNNSIKIWEADTESLDKIKKQKFPNNILRLLTRQDETPLIIFTNGNCASLSYALENRKSFETKSVVKEASEIVDAACYDFDNTQNICYIIKNSKESYEILTCPLREELGDLEKSKLAKVKISRADADVYVVGHLICSSEKLGVYVLWSDSKLSVYSFEKKEWKIIGSVPWISTNSSVSIAWMGKNHLILFGSNIEQDGAVIVGYNIVLGVGSCKYPMKMYTEGAKLYCYDNRIVLEASNHIGMMPYVLETKRNLSSLLGSHDINQDECAEIADWGTTTSPSYSCAKEIKTLINTGISERTICSQVIPSLVGQNDFRRVLRVIKEFKDVPESMVAFLISYGIKLVNPDNIDVTDTNKFTDLCSSNIEDREERIIKRAKFELLNYVLQIPVSDAMLIPYLRNGLSLDEALFLISYISYLFIDSNKGMSMEFESRLFDWCALLMDAFYQQYLITKDEKVTNVLDNMQTIIENLIDQLSLIDNILPDLHQIASGNQTSNEVEESLPYTIELMEI